MFAGLAAMAMAQVSAIAQSDLLGSIHLTKETSNPDPDTGMSTITLEQFVTGTTVTTVTSKPVDLILVLDRSSSMGRTVGSVTTYEASSTTSFNYDNTDESLFYLHSDGKYYPVQKEYTNPGYNYWLQYSVKVTQAKGNGKDWSNTSHTYTYYLDGTNTKATTPPTSYTTADEAIFTGSLYDNTSNTGKSIPGPYSYNSFQVPGTDRFAGKNTTGRPTSSSSLKYKYGKVTANYSEGPSANSTYDLFITINGTKRYLSGSSTTTTQPTDITTTSATIYSGKLYVEKTSGSMTRMDALKDGVKAFIDVIVEKAKGQDGAWDAEDDTSPDDVSNRIAIIPFDGDLDVTPLGLRDVKTESQVLYDYAADLSTGSGTRQDLGMEEALQYIQGIPVGRNSNKVVVMFTDGEPYWSGHNRDDVANNAIGYSYTMKQTYGVTVFSILVGTANYDKMDTFMSYTSSEYPAAESLTTAGATHDTRTEYYQQSDGADLSTIFSNIASSTTGDAYELTNNHTAAIDVLSDDFKLPDGFTPDSVDWEIWSCTGMEDGEYTWEKYAYSDPTTHAYTKTSFGTNNTDLYASDRPVVTLNYKHPDGTDIDPATESPRIMVSGFYYAMDDTRDESTNEVELYGNWVGARNPDATDEALKDYAGKKLVIKFNVKVKENSFGGFDLPSNKSTSGIYIDTNENGVYGDIDDEFIVAYNVPKVDVPSIMIRKYGLNIGDSAIFSVVGTAENNAAQKLCEYTVILTKTSASEEPFVILRGLPKGDYSVEEKGWAWTYESDDSYNGTTTKLLTAPTLPSSTTTDDYKAALINIQDGADYGKDLASETNHENYYVIGDAYHLLFKFVNTPKEGKLPLHGEDVVHNRFGNNGGSSAEHGGVDPEDHDAE